MTGAEAVLSLVLIEWAAGLLAVAAWTQSWSVVQRGHFKVIAWSAIAFALGGAFALRAAGGSASAELMTFGSLGSAVLYLGAQYVRSEKLGVMVAGIGAALGFGALVAEASEIGTWLQVVAAIELVAGAALLGGVTNGMLLGHWYLNQPGLKPWALARLTDLTLGAVVASAVLGLASAGVLATASTEGAVLGIPGFGASFALVFFLAWVAIVGLTGGVVWMARRCVKIRSIQSATGLFYVALLSAGVSEFLVRYLMVNS